MPHRVQRVESDESDSADDYTPSSESSISWYGNPAYAAELPNDASTAARAARAAENDPPLWRPSVERLRLPALEDANASNAACAARVPETVRLADRRCCQHEQEDYLQELARIRMMTRARHERRAEIAAKRRPTLAVVSVAESLVASNFNRTAQSVASSSHHQLNMNFSMEPCGRINFSLSIAASSSSITARSRSPAPKRMPRIRAGTQQEQSLQRTRPHKSEHWWQHDDRDRR